MHGSLTEEYLLHDQLTPLMWQFFTKTLNFWIQRSFQFLEYKPFSPLSTQVLYKGLS